MIKDKNGASKFKYIGHHGGFASVITINGQYYVPTGQGIFYEYWEIKEFPKDNRKGHVKLEEDEYEELMSQYDNKK